MPEFPDLVQRLLDGAGWSDWYGLPLQGIDPEVSRACGVYEIADQTGTTVYVGQTGGRFATRMGHLRDALCGTEIPFNDPHTAGPGMWVLRTEHGRTFRARLFVTPVSTPERRALETVRLAAVRRSQRSCPQLNYGGMPAPWIKSGSRRSGIRGVRAGGTNRALVPVPDHLTEDPATPTFRGMAWSEPASLDDHRAPAAPGFYRILVAGGTVEYIGQASRLSTRLAAHRNRVRNGTSAKYRLLAELAPLAVSWATTGLTATRDRLEVEDDLLAAAVTSMGRPPAAQYIEAGRLD